MVKFWRNVNHFNIVETPVVAHDGHELKSVSDLYVLDPEEPDSLGADVVCSCGKRFLSFEEELSDE